MASDRSRSLTITLLVLAAVALLVPIYQMPVWWVSLEAPNYPPEAFPDGVKILFRLSGVFNGCAKLEKAEIQVDEAVDCVHEMDTINHYVGMYPIAAGGPIEVSLSLFVLALLGVLALGFVVPRPAWRTGVMGLGFVAIAAWMAATWYGDNGLRYHSSAYLASRVHGLGELEGAEATDDALSPGAALIARLKASLEESGVEPAVPESGRPAPERDEKARDLEFLRTAYATGGGGAAGARAEWRGNGAQLLTWHYEQTLGRYFKEPSRIDPMVTSMGRAAQVAFWATLCVALVLIVGAWRTNGPFHWLLVLLPMTLPLLFVIEYAAWLWWYGHNMSDMGAFTLKPFMPTVFGQGKVAQFTTRSYPHFGFWLMVLFSGLLGTAALLRRNQIRDRNSPE